MIKNVFLFVTIKSAPNEFENRHNQMALQN